MIIQGKRKLEGESNSVDPPTWLILSFSALCRLKAFSHGMDDFCLNPLVPRHNSKYGDFANYD